MGTKVALVFGASGLVGRSVVRLLSESDDYTSVRIFARTETGLESLKKTEEHIIDFARLEDYSDLIKGNDLFICLGTTIKKAGSVKRMEEIDRDLPIKIASVASSNSVERLAVISALGASSKASNYYLRIKGEMEEGVKGLQFKTVIIARPSLLLGERQESRAGEAFAKFAMKIMAIFFVGRLTKYRGIEGRDVAKAIILAASVSTGIRIIESDELRKLAVENQNS